MTAKRSGARSKRPQRTGVSPPPRRRRAVNPLSPGSVSWATAVELLDAQGIDGLTMRRLADRLGSGVMSLYWHVDNKEDVFDLALDSVLEYRRPPQMVGSQDWPGEVVHMLEDWRASMLRHPWSHLCCRAGRSPNILGRLELLAEPCRSRCSRRRSERRDMVALELCDGATVTRRASTSRTMTGPRHSSAFTCLNEHYATIGRSRLLLDNDWDGAFRKGLDFLLDGLAPRQ